MESEQVLQKTKILAEKEVSLLQDKKYDQALKLAEKRRDVFSQLEHADLSLVTGIREKLNHLQEIQGALSQEAKRLHKMLRQELMAAYNKRQDVSGYHNTAIVTPLKQIGLNTMV